ncbi:MAG: hypothetical protein L0Y68_06055 [Candidatus Dadabacteria bacterium]|nr:hypothetical protein [Candidatus Dadabacteria bacterium]
MNLVERDIDTRRLVKSGHNVNKFQGSDYHIYRPDIVIKDNESTPLNRSFKMRNLQIEDIDQNLPDQYSSEKVNTRKYHESRKELSTNKLRTRNKKEPGYFNDKTVIKNEDEFQKRDNFVNPWDKKYQSNPGNKKSNFHNTQKSHGSLYKDTNLKNGYKFGKKTGSQQYRAFESNSDNVKEINDSDKRTYNRTTPIYNKGKTNTRGEKIRTKDVKRESRTEKRDINPRSAQKSKKSNAHKNSKGEVRPL